MDDVKELFDAWKRERPDIDVATMVSIGQVLRFAAQARARIAANAKNHGVTVEEGDVLFTLRRAGPPYQRSPTSLAQALLTPSGTLTGRLDRLEAKGLIERVPDPADRRAMSVRLTRRGIDGTDTALDAHMAIEAELLAPLTKAERRTLDQLMVKLLASSRP